MSLVIVMLIKGNVITISQLHYRDVERVLQTQAFDTVPERPTSRYLDGGYCVIDLNSKVIINAQQCFEIPNMKEFLVYHLN